MTDPGEVKVICKRCGKQAAAKDFVLHHAYQMMVCPICVQNYKNQPPKESPKENVKVVVERPKGWDEEDEYLERVVKKKEESVFTAKRIDATKVKYTCPKCKYGFVYDTERKNPGRCPYCAREIVKFVIVESKSK